MNGGMDNISRTWDRFDVYLFDLDGTLLQCKDTVHYFAFCHVLSWIAGSPINLEGVQAHGNTDTGILRDAFRLAGVKDAIWRPKLPEIRRAMCEYVTSREHELCAITLPDVRQVLNHLRAKGAMVGTATGNFRTIGQLKLKSADLLPYFQIGGWSDGFEARAEVFNAAASESRRLAGNHASICVVGDTPADIAAARANGLDIIAVATGIYSVAELSVECPDLCLESLCQLPLAHSRSA